MNILNLIKLYPQIDKTILKQYVEAEDIVVFNKDDRDLAPIHVSTRETIKKYFELLHPKDDFPEDDLWMGYKPDQWKYIENFGLPAKEQKYQRPEYPKKLAELEKRCDTLDEIYDELDNRKEYYASEITWIRNIWHKRLYGHWVFIDGQPTYLPGWHFFYCGFWELDIGYPDYRDRDRRFYLFSQYCMSTTSAPFKYRRKIAENYQYTSSREDFLEWEEHYKETKKNKPEKAPAGEYFWKEYGRRICFGFNYPKHRREGATFKAECENYEIISRTEKAKGGIQSLDETHSKKAFADKMIKPWKSLPFFFKPKFSGSTNPITNIRFEEPTRKSKNKGTMNVTKQGLLSEIDYATTASRDYYDGEKLISIHTDEEGKTSGEKVDERWLVLKQCLSMGGGRKIVGFNISTSTVGEMTKKGGAPYFRLCKDSMWENRVPESGQTTSGKFNLFIPAYDGLEGFVDDFGRSVIEDPEVPIILENGDKIEIGAKRHLAAEAKDKLGDGSPKNIEKYHEFLRQHPTRFRECFLSSSSDTGFNIKILSERINELEMNEKLQPVPGDFVWENRRFGNVKWMPNPQGKFRVSLVLPPDQANLSRVIDGQQCPAFPDRFVASADAFRFEKTAHRRMSEGGGSVFWKRNETVDPSEKPIQDWESNRFVCTYSNRVATKEEYIEDMLKMTIYYGAMMYPEINVPDVWDRFRDWGFLGYLLFDYDPITEKVKPTPGFSSVGNNKVKLFGELKEYIEHHGHRERHIDLLKECIEIQGLEEMTDYDLFTSAGGSLLGVKSDYASILNREMGNEESEDGVDISEMMW